MELFFGSEGVMGLIFEATLRTYELPKFSESILVKTNDLSEIHSVINEERNLISAVEFMDYNCLKLLEEKNLITNTKHLLSLSHQIKMFWTQLLKELLLKILM